VLVGPSFDQLVRYRTNCSGFAVAGPNYGRIVSGSIGERVGVGRTSDVFVYGDDAVVKVPHPDVPDDWPVFEAALSQHVHAIGVPVPAVHGIVEIDGRSAVVFERVAGPSMWQHMRSEPSRIDELVGQLVEIQRAVLAADLPTGVPDSVDRLVRRITIARKLDDADRQEAIRCAHELPRGAALLHGDLHPGNVLMGVAGPVVIDWFDVSIGHPLADIVRSSILMRPGRDLAPDHLPGATPDMLGAMHSAYVNAFSTELETAGVDIAKWQAVLAAGRLGENAEADDRWLVELWRARSAIERGPSALSLERSHR